MNEQVVNTPELTHTPEPTRTPKPTRTPRQRRRRRAAIAIAALALAILALGGTFAWNNYLQHKTNTANLGGLFYRAMLVENYDPAKAANWQIQDPPLTKQISVLNPGPTTPQDKNTYGDVYARIQLKEFMEMYPISQTVSDVRYMIDTTGNFVSFDNAGSYLITLDANNYPVATEVADGTTDALVGQAAATAYAQAMSAKVGNATHTIAQERQFYTPIKTNSVAANPKVAAAHPDWVSTSDPTTFDPTKVFIDPVNGLDDADLPWYIQTEAGDPNGVYGNFMTTDAYIDYSDGTSLVPGVTRADEDQTANQNDATSNVTDLGGIGVGGNPPANNDECLYTPHLWTQGLYAWDVNGPGQPTFDDYVAWVYGPDVILASQWNGQPCNKWIIDDSPSNTQGWVYWGNPIEPGQQTTDFLDALTMVQQPGARVFYTIHTDLEAVSYDELYRWNTTNDTSGNDAIVAALMQAGIKVTGVSISTTPATVARGTTFNFNAVVQGVNGVNQQVTWSLDKTNGGSEITSINANTGQLSVGLGETNATLTVTAASVQDPTLTASWTVTVTDNTNVTSVTLTPSPANVNILTPTQFTGTEVTAPGYGAGMGVSYTVTGYNGYTIQDANTQISPTGVLTIGPTETLYQQLLVTATSTSMGFTDKSATAVVTIYPQLMAQPTIATTRYIPAASAGDTSDWVEIATNGGYSLMLRRDYLPDALTGVTEADTTYPGSKQQTAINTWFASTNPATGLSANAPLRSMIVGNTAMANLGTSQTLSDGYSAPTGATGATGADTAFALSYGESAAFVTAGNDISGALTTNVNPAAQPNYDFLTANYSNDNSLCTLLRSPSQINKWTLFSFGNFYSANSTLDTGGFAASRVFAQPAVWIDTADAQAQGLLVDRYPTVATTRYITAAAAGDTSDWVEVATYGDNSLMLRRDPIQPELAGVTAADGNYVGSTQQTAINNWFADTTDLTAAAPLRSVIEGNTAMANLGKAVSGYTGFSLPAGAAGATGLDTAFALSWGEAYQFCALGACCIDGVNYTFPTGQIPASTANADFIIGSYNISPSVTYADEQGALLRTPAQTGVALSIYIYNQWIAAKDAPGILMTGNGLTRHYYAQPAVWIKTSAAEDAGLFSDR